MAKEYKTFTFPDTPNGRNRMENTINDLAYEGWSLKSKEVSSQGYSCGSTCCWGCLFLPLALLGKKKNLIHVTMERTIKS